MLVAHILKTKGGGVHTASPGASLAAVASVLHELRVGALVIVEGEDVVGILSERDIIAAVSREGAVALDRPVSDWMTKEVVFALPQETVDDLLGRMTDRRLRHLPILDNGRLAGIVSIGDLVKWKITEVTAEADGLKAYIAAG